MSFERKIFRQDTCENCDSYLHCCLNCEFYDPNAHKQCREPLAYKTTIKDAQNFCEYFEPRHKPGKPDTSRADDARSKLDALFKKKDD